MLINIYMHTELKYSMVIVLYRNMELHSHDQHYKKCTYLGSLVKLSITISVTASGSSNGSISLAICSVASIIECFDDCAGS